MWFSAMSFLLRPHIVTVQWLLDSFSHGSLLPEDGYFHSSFLPPAPVAVNVPALHKAAPRASRTSVAPPPAPSPARQSRAEDDLLSQYMGNDQTVGELINLSSVYSCPTRPLISACLSCSGASSGHWLYQQQAERFTSRSSSCREGLHLGWSLRGWPVFRQAFHLGWIRSWGWSPAVGASHGERWEDFGRPIESSGALCHRAAAGLWRGGNSRWGCHRYLAGKHDMF